MKILKIEYFNKRKVIRIRETSLILSLLVLALQAPLKLGAESAGSTDTGAVDTGGATGSGMSNPQQGSWGSSGQTGSQGAKKSKTPIGDQASTQQDRNMVQDIRQSLMEDDSLSALAESIRIVARNGSVTLRGAVQSQEQKEQVAEVARNVAGDDKVQNNLKVKQGAGQSQSQSQSQP